MTLLTYADDPHDHWHDFVCDFLPGVTFVVLRYDVSVNSELTAPNK